MTALICLLRHSYFETKSWTQNIVTLLGEVKSKRPSFSKWDVAVLPYMFIKMEHHIHHTTGNHFLPQEILIPPLTFMVVLRFGYYAIISLQEFNFSHHQPIPVCGDKVKEKLQFLVCSLFFCTRGKQHNNGEQWLKLYYSCTFGPRRPHLYFVRSKQVLILDIRLARTQICSWREVGSCSIKYVVGYMLLIGNASNY
jgi:hypothetical protein